MKKARTDGEKLLETRILIDNYDASVVIGKGGTNVKQVRTESKAFVSILKHDGGSTKERVLQVTGNVESNAAALRMIADILIANDAERSSSKPGSSPKEAWSFKILIHKNQVGALIG